jgi:hypothetical protein
VTWEGVHFSVFGLFDGHGGKVGLYELSSVDPSLKCMPDLSGLYLARVA